MIPCNTNWSDLWVRILYQIDQTTIVGGYRLHFAVTSCDAWVACKTTFITARIQTTFTLFLAILLGRTWVEMVFKVFTSHLPLPIPFTLFPSFFLLFNFTFFTMSLYDFYKVDSCFWGVLMKVFTFDRLSITVEMKLLHWTGPAEIIVMHFNGSG